MLKSILSAARAKAIVSASSIAIGVAVAICPLPGRAETIVGASLPSVTFDVTTSMATVNLDVWAATSPRVEVWALSAPYSGDAQGGVKIFRWDAISGGPISPAIPISVPAINGQFYLVAIEYAFAAVPFQDIVDSYSPGATYRPGTLYGSCQLSASSNDTRYCAFVRNSFINFVGSLQCSGGQCNTTTALPGPVMPQTGLWAIDAENNGNPGRGFAFELQNGTFVVTVFAYDQNGAGEFYQAAGVLSNSTFSGTLDFYKGGTTFGGTFQSAIWAGSAGPVVVKFTDSTHGTITLPGEAEKVISKISW
jgi:hypothetical protein